MTTKEQERKAFLDKMDSLMNSVAPLIPKEDLLVHEKLADRVLEDFDVEVNADSLTVLKIGIMIAIGSIDVEKIRLSKIDKVRVLIEPTTILVSVDRYIKRLNGEI